KCGSIEEVYERIDGLTKSLFDNKNVAGFCYTQLTDVEQEKNGIYTYSRQRKFDMKRIKAIFDRKTRP
ncbi:MAG: beta-galactosidase, partial [Abditibacteriota bacterium]|nr:beta-galactosidase [Abditibacteriota bacterium]